MGSPVRKRVRDGTYYDIQPEIQVPPGKIFMIRNLECKNRIEESEEGMKEGEGKPCNRAIPSSSFLTSFLLFYICIQDS